MKKEKCCLRIARTTGLLWLVLFFPVMLQAQEKHHAADSVTGYGKLASLIKSGEFEFHMRSFYMQTINKGDLMDYASLAQGGGLGYYSPSFKGFHVGFSGFFVFQMFENNLRVPDPRTGGINRYEILLYDMNDYKNRKDLDRLEHLYLSYLRENFFASLPRERFEGNGDVLAWTLKYNWTPAIDRLAGNIGVSSVKGPDLNSFYLNKYGIPSYYHFSGSLDYAFSGYLEGMDLKLLVVNKTARHPGEVPDRFRINRVDLWNLNLIMDFRF
jgi:hypothetical protein